MAVTIQNGRGLTRFDQYPQALEPGVPQGDGDDMPWENSALAQIATTTWSAAADVSDEIVEGQTIRTTLTDPDGTAYVIDHVVTEANNTAGTDGAGLALVASLQAAAINASDALANIVIASASAAVCTVQWLHNDERGNWGYTSTVVPAAAETTLVSTEVAAVQGMGGTVIPMARFVARATPPTGGKRRCTLPSGATAVLVGVALRDESVARSSSVLSATTNDYPVGSMVAVRERGGVPVDNVGDATAQAGDPVYVVIATTGGDALGQARTERDGTADVWTATPTAANATVYGLTIEFAPWDGEDGETFVLGDVTSDGDGTQTEISDAFKTLIATAPYARLRSMLSVSASGAATIVFTGTQLGRPFIVMDTAQAGAWTSITHTTTAAQYTVKASGARWREVTPAGSPGTIYVNF